MNKKILIITHNEERHYYFANQIINSNTKVSDIIIGAKYNSLNNNNSFLRKIKKKKFIKALKNRFLNIVFKSYNSALSKELIKTEKYYFKDQEKEFIKKNSKLNIYYVKKDHNSVNDQKYLEIIYKIKPKIILVMGSCLLSEKIISSCKYVLNLHTGLSPYYRGSNSNLWPIANNDLYKTGYTIHLMSNGIDSGDIIYTGNCNIELNDTYASINSKNIKLGTKYIIKAVNKIYSNNLKSKKQWFKGKLYLNDDINNYIIFKYFKNLENFVKKSINNNFVNYKKVKLIDNGIFKNLKD